MANFNKNIFVGTGGSEGINFSHFIGAVYGMERMMGRADNPLRRILNYASTNFLQKLPLIYIQTVIGRGYACCGWSAAVTAEAELTRTCVVTPERTEIS